MHPLPQERVPSLREPREAFKAEQLCRQLPSASALLLHQRSRLIQVFGCGRERLLHLLLLHLLCCTSCPTIISSSKWLHLVLTSSLVLVNLLAATRCTPFRVDLLEDTVHGEGLLPGLSDHLHHQFPLRQFDAPVRVLGEEQVQGLLQPENALHAGVLAVPPRLIWVLQLPTLDLQPAASVALGQ